MHWPWRHNGQRNDGVLVKSEQRKECPVAERVKQGSNGSKHWDGQGGSKGSVGDGEFVDFAESGVVCEAV